MRREWKPGDVAMVSRPGTGGKYPHAAMFTDEGWCCRSFGQGCDGEPVRQLVVIDPEDRKQAERLVRAYDKALDKFTDYRVGNQTTAMQAALRSLVEPPKPEEPTDPAARVIDRDGDEWARTIRTLGGRWSSSSVSGAVTWDHLLDAFGPVEVVTS